MSPRIGHLIGLGFAFLWLLAGSDALVQPWRTIVLIGGGVAIAGLAVRAWRTVTPLTGRFDMRRYRIAVAAEVGALVLVGYGLGKVGLAGYLIPVAGIIVGLHFIGLWWAGGGVQFLWLSIGMTAIDAAALLLPPGSAAMQAAAGLGSAAALAAASAVGTRR